MVRHQLVLAAFMLLGGCRAVQVTTKYGTVEGKIVTLESGVEVRSFLGVPYGKPPVGNLRFKPTEEVEPWEGVRNATELGSTCHGGGMGLTHPTWDNFDEDCLNVNIYTPDSSSTPGPFPVMVWFHGGAYRSGSNILYPGHWYAAKDVISVVANYRLGSLGWISTGDDVAKGNYGLWDQRQALIFVQETISSFGGDPSRVTVFGQSAGASSIGLHIVSPQSRGLFQQAIMHSGSDLAPWSNNPSWLPPEQYTRDVAEGLDCPTNDTQAMIDCLRQRDARDVSRAAIIPISGYISLGFAPTPDGPGGFLPENPFTLREKGDFNKDVKIIVGHTTEDGATYLLPFVPEAIDGGWNRSLHVQYIKERMVDWVLARETENIRVNVAKAMEFYFTDWPYTEDTVRNRRQLLEAVNDVGFGVAQDLVLKNHTQFNTTFEYLYGYRGNPHRLILPDWFGASHGISDIPYIWGFPMLEDNPEVEEDSEHFLMRIFPWTDEDKQYSDFMITLLSNFAKFGNPTPTPIAPPGNNTSPPVTWEEFKSDQLNYFYIGNDAVETRQNLNQKNNAFWREYIPYIIERDNSSKRENLGDNDWSYDMFLDTDVAYDYLKDLLQRYMGLY